LLSNHLFENLKEKQKLTQKDSCYAHQAFPWFLSILVSSMWPEELTNTYSQ